MRLLHHLDEEVLVAELVDVVEVLCLPGHVVLPAHFARHHDIGFYASQLSISPVYLSRIVRQVADRLHFADSASFCKFFQRQKGTSPRRFRESQ